MQISGTFSPLSNTTYVLPVKQAFKICDACPVVCIYVKSYTLTIIPCNYSQTLFIVKEPSKMLKQTKKNLTRELKPWGCVFLLKLTLVLLKN